MTDDEFEALVYTATDSAAAAKGMKSIPGRYTHVGIGLTHALCALAVSVRDFSRAVTPPKENQ